MIMGIVEKLKGVEKLYHGTGCKTSQVKEAQDALGLEFPEEYIDYVKEFGAVSFYGTEWTGLNVEGYLNVVDATRQERSLNPSFPEDCFVLENQGIDGILTIMSQSGKIYELQYDKSTFLCDSLLQYLELCVQRRK